MAGRAGSDGDWKGKRVSAADDSQNPRIGKTGGGDCRMIESNVLSRQYGVQCDNMRSGARR